MSGIKRMFSVERGLHGAAFVLALATIATQLLALVRDRLLAGTFGVGELLDVYYAAFRIPDLLFVSVASLFSAAVVIPFFVSRFEKDGGEAEFFSSLVQGFMVLMVPVLVLVFVLMPRLAPLVAPGIDPAQYGLLVLFSRVLLLSPLLLGLSSIVSGAVQALRYFLLFSLAPLLYNVGIIVGILLLYPTFGPVGLVYGVTLGALLHLLIQLPVVIKHGLLVRVSDVAGTVKTVLLTSVPRTVALSMTQLQIVIFTALASLFAVGSIAAFQLGHNLQSIPLSLIGVSYSVAAFPALASLWSKGAYVEFCQSVRRAEGHVVLWSVLLGALFLLLRQDIVEVVLGVGAFAGSDVLLVAGVLGIFSLSLPAQSLVLLYSRAWYAMHETRIPLIANGVGALMSVVLAYVIRERVVTAGLPELYALPIAFGVGIWLSALILRVWYVRRVGELSGVLWLHALIGAGIVAVVLVVFKPFYTSFIGTGSVFQQFLIAAGAGIDAGAVAVLYWYVVGARPAKELVDGLRRRLVG